MIWKEYSVDCEKQSEKMSLLKLTDGNKYRSKSESRLELRYSDDDEHSFAQAGRQVLKAHIFNLGVGLINPTQKEVFSNNSMQMPLLLYNRCRRHSASS